MGLVGDQYLRMMRRKTLKNFKKSQDQRQKSTEIDSISRNDCILGTCNMTPLLKKIDLRSPRSASRDLISISGFIVVKCYPLF